ncbi:uncharacterized protein YjiS (DUF1127 family) [Pelomonas saccharophila]|uniref:Uncharacterized protein YjiS (DUF1127 family) n=1 Tax=Roseateles saccharophilus TaxID=304 RepID=A0ABU1YJR6_ROSSA|nr:hypothetical protein [Roseateles saccharophilus]MDR7268963.1 uncharacterized protein YjiS (DUF1127 family) [Roseateles saccharophilus]
MLQEINTWADYRSKLREFDAVLEHGRAAAVTLGGLSAASPQVSYGQQIFLKLLAHCSALRRLAPDPTQPPPRELSDLPSMCALARCVIEAHDAFEYIAGHAVTESERGFRIRLWELHDATRRLKILGGTASANPAVATILADAARLQLALEAHEYMASLPAVPQAELRLRLRRSDPPDFHLTRRQRCALSGMDADWHKAVTMQLSLNMLTLPFSVQQSSQFQAGTPEALRLMAMPLLFALPFLARVIQSMDQLIPGKIPRPPSRTARTMALWRRVGEQDEQAGDPR